MSFVQKSLRKSINKAYLKLRVARKRIETFKKSTLDLLTQIDDHETEEFHKTCLSRFLQTNFQGHNFYINTKGYNDLVIHNGKDNSSSVGVIIEVKKPKNKAEMIRRDNLNAKALQEILLYYLRERITNNNKDLKHLIITNLYEWFIFDATAFEETFAKHRRLIEKFNDFENGRLGGRKTEYFYKEIAEPIIDNIQLETPYIYFDLRDYKRIIENHSLNDDSQLVTPQKILSPEFLLKLQVINDSNTLDKSFYTELLHIIGLTEVQDKGRKLIQRPDKKDRIEGTLLENAIAQIDSLDKISRIQNPSKYGKNTEEVQFALGLELVITWINRILFIKLLEGQLKNYFSRTEEQPNDFRILDLSLIKNYDDLNTLFFQALAKKTGERTQDTKPLFAHVPYLNSSLFEPTDIEHNTLFISNLKNDLKIPFYSNTVLKDANGKKRTGAYDALTYLFEFLSSYDFSGEGTEAIQEDNKTLINASVLGLIFEKINGYKDGSFFTPSYITMYMCRESIRKAVIQRFSEVKGKELKDLTEVYNAIDDAKEANDIINSIRICDPAVGSGHFLVSALNELIFIKHDLKILNDKEGRRLKEYKIEINNDELEIFDENDEPIAYNFNNPESQRIQEAIFHEKETIIENCLFGVDINPNSVKICRLRLWIELLKHAYFRKEDGRLELETLPNIDINIKEGNSLISRFSLDADISQALKTSRWNLQSYKNAVQSYRDAESKEYKREMQHLIDIIKSDFRTEINKNDPNKKKIYKLSGDLYNLQQSQLFELSAKEKKVNQQKLTKIQKELDQLQREVEAKNESKMYENAFEWRFEFPEVLDQEGNYHGFDVIIGNPPYIQLQSMGQQSTNLQKLNYNTFERTGDIYSLFYELGFNLLRPKGVLAYITSNKWMRANYGESTREFFSKHTNPILLLDFAGTKVFDSATVDVNILIFTKEKNRQQTLALTVQEHMLKDLSGFVRQKGVVMSFGGKESWVILSEMERRIREKIEKVGTPLKEWDIQINYGIKTGLNEAFIISGEKRKELIDEDPKSAEIIRPILRGRDIKKYGYEFADLWLINTHNGVKEQGIEKVDVGKYPAIKSHLNHYYDKLNERADRGDSPYNLRNCSYLMEFSKPKIIFQEMVQEPCFALDKDGTFFCLDTARIITGENLEILLAILNSNLFFYAIKKFYAGGGLGTSGVRMKHTFFSNFPITEFTSEERQNLLNLLNDKNYSEMNRLIYNKYSIEEFEVDLIESQ